MSKAYSRIVKRTLAMSPEEDRAVARCAEAYGLRGLAPLRVHSLREIVRLYGDAPRRQESEQELA